METKKFLKIIVAVLVVLNLGTLLYVFMNQRHPGKNGHRGKENPGEFIIRELDFTDQQVQQFDELKLEHQTQMKAFRDSIRVQREKLPELIIGGNDPGADSVSTQIGRYQKGIELCTYEHFKKVYAICDDKQKKKFKNIIGEVLTMMAPPPGRPHK